MPQLIPRRFVLAQITTAVLFLVGFSALAHAESPGRIHWRDGDRVVFLGNALIERDQASGYFETALVSRFPDRDLTIRNLGWSGDTVFGHARAGFGSVADGFNKLKQHIDSIKPRVVFVAYGGVESFDGEAGLPNFVKGLNTLLDVLSKHADRIVLLSPNRHENLGPPLPDPKGHNENLARYRDAIRQVALQRGYLFVDLYDTLGTDPNVRLTDDGIHFNDYGGWRLAQVLSSGVGLAPRVWRVKVGGGAKPETAGSKLDDPRIDNRGFSFRLLDEALPSENLPKCSSQAAERAESERVLTVEGLKPGRYTLSIDGEKILSATSAEWERGVPLAKGPEFDQLERLRAAIHRKNQLYFYRWRPQNETYLFGFRNYEQGRNAREVPLFDPLVGEREKEIAVLRVPKPHIYELHPDGKAKR